MWITIKHPTTNITQGVLMPCNEMKIIEINDNFHQSNDMQSMVVFDYAHDEPRLTNLLGNTPLKLSELNMFMTLFDTLTKNEVNTFFAVAEAYNFITLPSLINLTANTNCYHLIADFSNLDTLGKNLFLNKHGAASPEFLKQFDGARHVMQIMTDNPSPVPTKYGYVYRNENPEQRIYNGQCFPRLPINKPLTICLNSTYDREYLYLPFEQSELDKALERLEIDDLSKVNIEVDDYDMPKNIADIVIADISDLEKLNKATAALHEVGNSELPHLSKLVEITKVDNTADLETLAKSMFEFEFLPDIHSDFQFGYHMIAESGRFEYDENLKEYIDFERYGRERNLINGGIYTEHGYLNYLGYNQNMCDILNKNLDMSIEAIPQNLTMRLYMPIEVTTYYEEDEYGRYWQTDNEGTLDDYEYEGYAEEFNDFLDEYQPEKYTERGLMEYYDEADSVNAKVKSYHFEFEQIDGIVYGVAVCKLNAPLDAEELQQIKITALSQASDGLGEGFEQKAFDLKGRDVYIHLWQSDDNWYIKTAEEMGFVEQQQCVDMQIG